MTLTAAIKIVTADQRASFPGVTPLGAVQQATSVLSVDTLDDNATAAAYRAVLLASPGDLAVALGVARQLPTGTGGTCQDPAGCDYPATHAVQRFMGSINVCGHHAL